MMLKVVTTKQFEKDFALAKKRGKKMEKLKEVLNFLVAKEGLPPKYKDHSLVGNYINHRECHIEPDWLLLYKVDSEEEKLYLTRTGSHSDLF